MTGPGEREGFEDRSIYEACIRCGAMVATTVDRARHTRWHAQLAEALETRERGR